MTGVFIVTFNDDGRLAFTPEAFEEFKVKGGLDHVRKYEHWLDKREAKIEHDWIS